MCLLGKYYNLSYYLTITFLSEKYYNLSYYLTITCVCLSGKYYNLSYYLAQKDNQIAQLIQAGNKVQELNRGSIDLSRMMNRVSQVTDFAARKKWAKKSSDTSSAVQEPEEAEDSKDFDFRVRACCVYVCVCSCVCVCMCLCVCV